MTEDAYTIQIGHLDVGDGHKIYYQQWGNASAPPVFVLHGGPIYFSKDRHKLDFDPKRHNVIFHDQRGCGQSTYENRRAANNSDARVADIEKLREHLGCETIQIYGYSWGSTLALYFAEKHPSVVSKMMIGGVFTATQKEIDTIFQSEGANSSPDAWDYYVHPVPSEQRSDTLAYYENALQNGTDAQKLESFKRFIQLESAASSPDGDYAAFLQDVQSTDNLDELDDALLSIEWFRSGCYIPQDYIFQNLSKLAAIPIIIVQGRTDFVCPPKTAYELRSAIGDNAHLQFVPGGHNSSRALKEVVKAHAYHFFA